MKFTFEVVCDVPAVLTSVEVDPPILTVPFDQPATARVIGKDQAGNVIPVTILNAQSDTPDFGATAAGDLVTVTTTATMPGTYRASVSGDAA